MVVPHPVAVRLRGRALAAVCACLVAVVQVVALLLAVPASAAGGGSPADRLVADATQAFDSPGVLAVAISRQARRADEGTVRALEARAARRAAYGADNGAVADRPFPTASMVKLFMVEDILTRARAGEVSLGSDDRDLLRAAIRQSDDPAASALWVRYGGGRMVRDVAARYGLTATGPPPARIPGQWGQAVTSATDLARFLALLPVVAHPDDAETLLGWMREATPVAADGFDQQFGLFGTLPGAPAVKQGWMCCVAGQRHLHSLAVLDGRVIVLVSEVPRTVGYAAATAALTAAGAAVAAGLTAGDDG